MPKTPEVNFNFVNNNVEQSVPLLGVSHVLARTTKGPFNDPSELISSYAQFQRIFGKEIVPNGTISNIKVALDMGAKLRVSRVAGKGDTSLGTAKTLNGNSAAYLKLTLASLDGEITEVFFDIKTREAGSSIVNSEQEGTNANWYLKLVSSNDAPTYQCELNQYLKLVDDLSDSESLFTSETIWFGGRGDTDADYYFNLDTFRSFVSNSKFIQVLYNKSLNSSLAANSIEDVFALLDNLKNKAFGELTFISGEALSSTSDPGLGVIMINEGSNGGDSDLSTWVEAYEASAEYTDAYELICSHLAQHLPNDYKSIYAAIGTLVSKNKEVQLYVDIPAYTMDANTGVITPITDPELILNDLREAVKTIGKSEFINYYVGGIKYYDNNGILRNCDTNGTVLGLACISATSKGPWYSFAGQNRGLVPNALGPVMSNLGPSSRKEDLQKIADWFGNLFVIKDTRSNGKQTMLWHSFTSSPVNTSNKFISIVRTNLYIKKNVRPTLESYIEEPNTWETWKKIYYEAKEILDEMVGSAMSEYTWIGDQFATSYSELQVNNEADVRQGKYKIVLRYKDIVTLQEVTMDIVIDSVSKEIEISNE